MATIAQVASAETFGSPPLLGSPRCQLRQHPPAGPRRSHRGPPLSHDQRSPAPTFDQAAGRTALCGEKVFAAMRRPRLVRTAPGTRPFCNTKGNRMTSQVEDDLLQAVLLRIRLELGLTQTLYLAPGYAGCRAVCPNSTAGDPVSASRPSRGLWRTCACASCGRVARPGSECSPTSARVGAQSNLSTLSYSASVRSSARLPSSNSAPTSQHAANASQAFCGKAIGWSGWAAARREPANVAASKAIAASSPSSGSAQRPLSGFIRAKQRRRSARSTVERVMAGMAGSSVGRPT